ncbi:MAG: histidinol dehydrogenase [Gammaproteobacteria bacterium]|nr:histidinol dehydrogenase [Gammaproteobacteria bacterium]
MERELKLRRLDAAAAAFEGDFSRLLDRAPADLAGVNAAVDDVILAVRSRGDQALIEYAARFDRHRVEAAADFELPRARLAQAWGNLDPDLRQVLDIAARRIRDYAERQRPEDWEYQDALGNRLGQRVTPLDRVGIYVPGGKAAYPSSVLMNAIPAAVAGVGEIVMCVPAPGGVLDQAVLGAAHLAGVHRVFTIGGAQAIAALAFGTETVPAVDKIVGPGNAYVAAAKRRVFGRVGIDSVAGPSEVLIVADGSADPDTLALDLFAQAEHDETAQSLLVCPDVALLDAVEAAVAKSLPVQPRAAIIAESLRRWGALIHVCDLDQAAELANRVAPEHLQLAIRAPRALLPKIRHAGAIFLGYRTPEAFGDYCAGPNHVLPTARAARYASPLGVYEFVKCSTLLECSAAGAAEFASIAGRLADAEGLAAHAASARSRKR